MDLRQDSFVEVTSTVASEEAVVSNSRAMIESVGGAGCEVREMVAASQAAAVTIPLEEPQAEKSYNDAPRVEVQMVGASAWGPAEDENIKDEYLTGSSMIKEQEYHRLQLPEEEVILFNLEETNEGIQLVGKPVAKSVIPTPHITTTISLSAVGEVEKTYSQDRNRFLQITQGVPAVKRKFVSDSGSESKQLSRNGAGVALLGCCLCYEIFSSRKALQLHVAVTHQQSKTVSCQVILPIVII